MATEHKPGSLAAALLAKLQQGGKQAGTAETHQPGTEPTPTAAESAPVLDTTREPAPRGLIARAIGFAPSTSSAAPLSPVSRALIGLLK